MKLGASRLVALGRLELGIDPTVALAFARKSLTMHDTPEARRLAVEALWRGPTARLLTLPPSVSCASLIAAPDGDWLECDGGDEGRSAPADRAAAIRWSIDGRRLEEGDSPAVSSGGEEAGPRVPRPFWKGRSLFLRRPGRDGQGDRNERLGEHAAAIRRAAWHDETAAVVSVGEDREIRIWAGPKLELRHVRRGPDSRIFSLPRLDRSGTRLVWHSLRERAGSRPVRFERAFTRNGKAIQAVAIDPPGEVIATGDTTGVVRVGRLGGGEPHLLLGASGVVSSVDFSPDGRWVAGAAGNEIWLWPMPDVSKPPLHTLPHDSLMTTLDTFTNVQLVEDESTPTGYRSEARPFPGWEMPPTW